MVSPVPGPAEEPYLVAPLMALPIMAKFFAQSGISADELKGWLAGDVESLRHAPADVLSQVQTMAAFGFRCACEHIQQTLAERDKREG